MKSIECQDCGSKNLISIGSNEFQCQSCNSRWKISSKKSFSYLKDKKRDKIKGMLSQKEIDKKFGKF